MNRAQLKGKPPNETNTYSFRGRTICGHITESQARYITTLIIDPEPWEVYDSNGDYIGTF